MTRITLIQCTNAKRDEPEQAKHLYDESAYFRKMRAWAEARGNPWYILSAKHGLVGPDERLAPYDDRGLDDGQADVIAEQLVDMDVDVVDVTAGRDYTNPLVPALEQRGIDVVEHFAGMKIGERMSALADKTLELRNRG